MIVRKTNIDGIDLVIDELQSVLYDKFLTKWQSGVNYEMYPRANKLIFGNDILPMVSVNDKEYDLTMFDDKFAATSFFLADDNSSFPFELNQVKRRLSIIFQVNLKKLYNSNERLDEVFNMDVLRFINRKLDYVTTGVEITEGFDNVYNDFVISPETKEKVKISDASHFHIVKFSFDIEYQAKKCIN